MKFFMHIRGNPTEVKPNMSGELYSHKGDTPAKQEPVAEPSLYVVSDEDQKTYLARRQNELGAGDQTIDEQFGTPQLTGQATDSPTQSAKRSFVPEEWNGRLDKAGREYFRERYGVEIVEISQDNGLSREVVVRRSSDGRQLLSKKYSNHQDFVDNFETHVTEHSLVKQHLARKQAEKLRSLPQNPGYERSRQEAPPPSVGPQQAQPSRQSQQQIQKPDPKFK